MAEKRGRTAVRNFGGGDMITPQRFQNFTTGILLAGLVLAVAIALFIFGAYH